jgi:hypothetical protein
MGNVVVEGFDDGSNVGSYAILLCLIIIMFFMLVNQMKN